MHYSIDGVTNTTPTTNATAYPAHPTTQPNPCPYTAAEPIA